MTQKYQQRYEQFYQRFCSIDDGQASKEHVKQFLNKGSFPLFL